MFAYADLVTVAQAFQNMAEGGLEKSQCKRNKRKEANNLQIITNTEQNGTFCSMFFKAKSSSFNCQSKESDVGGQGFDASKTQDMSHGRITSP